MEALARMAIADREAREIEAISRSNPEAAARILESRDRTGRIALGLFFAIFGGILVYAIIAGLYKNSKNPVIPPTLPKQEEDDGSVTPPGDFYDSF